ncbi:metallophosphoesterase [Mucilaginibacter sp. AW1-3]
MKQILNLRTTSWNPKGIPFKNRHLSVLSLIFAAFLGCSFFFMVSISSCKKSNLTAETTSSDNPTAQNSSGQLKLSSLPGTDFNIVVMPDIQYETSNKNGATDSMLTSQIRWIKAHQADSNIVYVIGLGDITDDGDSQPFQWVNAKNAYYMLESPLTGLPSGIPYGLAVGNHDQYPNQGFPLTDATSQYNTYFGTSHFSGRSYYGGNYTGGSGANDSHYDLFSGGGLDWICIYLEYDSQNQDRTAMNTWAYNLLGTYASRKAIIVTHYFLDNGSPAPWGATGGVNATNSQGQGIYDRLKTRRNVCLFLSGHVGGEAYRQDTYQGRTIKTIMADYQFNTNGGNGYMRLMHFSRDNDRIGVRTYSPWLNTFGFGSFTKTLFHEPVLTRTCDFDNNGKSNLAFFNNGTWKVSGLSNVTQGAAGDIPCPGDYNGDGETDYVYFHPADGTWHNLPGGVTTQYGQAGDIPVPGDFDGDGKTDLAIYRPSATANTNKFYYLLNGVSNNVQYGTTGDIPIPGDFDGDGTSDMAVYRPSTRTFYFYGVTSFVFGSLNDIPVPGDYDGDGLTDIAIYRPSNGTWYIRNAADGTTKSSFQYWSGTAGDIPCIGDYLGTGKTGYAYYRSGVLNINGGTSITLGGSGDKILNLPYSLQSVYFP